MIIHVCGVLGLKVICAGLVLFVCICFVSRNLEEGRHERDRMVFVFTTTYVINAYHH